MTREYRRWLNRLRAKFGKRNGVIRGALLDSPKMDRKMLNGKKLQRDRRGNAI